MNLPSENQQNTPQTSTSQASIPQSTSDKTSSEVMPIEGSNQTNNNKTKVTMSLSRKGNWITIQPDSQGGLTRTDFDEQDIPYKITKINQHQQLESITYLATAGRKERVYTFQYDKYGFLVKQKSGFGIPILPEITEWWRNTKPTRKTRFSRWTGKAISFQEGSHEPKPDVNEYEGITEGFFQNGQISKIVMYDFLDHPRHIKNYCQGELSQEILYDLLERVIFKRWYDMHKEGSSFIHTISERTYNDKQKVIGMKFVETTLNSHKKPQTTNTYVNGILSQQIRYTYDSHNQLSTKTERDYNTSGKCSEERLLTPTDKLISAIRHEYTASGHRIDSYIWTGQEWISDKTANKKAPASLATPPAHAEQKQPTCSPKLGIERS